MAGAFAIGIEVAQGNGQHRAVAVYRGLKQSAFERAQAFAIGGARFGEKCHRATKMQFFGNHGIDFGGVFALGTVDEQSAHGHDNFAQYRPRFDFLLGDKLHRVHRGHGQDVQP